MRALVIVGLDGRSNPIYIYRDQLDMSAYMRDTPTWQEILRQYPKARYTLANFKTVPLQEAVSKYFN